MPSTCFLVSTEAVHVRHDNRTRLPNAFRDAGWHVNVSDHQAVTLSDQRVVLQPGGTDLADFDLIWVLGFGNRESYLDRTQLLASLPANRFVNSPLALQNLHAKYHLALSELARHHPETYASSDPQWLRTVIASGGDWIAKPAAGSFGRGVFRVNARDPNLAVILEQLTGPEHMHYCLVQRFVAEIAAGEKRVLLANGEIIGTYLRLPGDDHRVNLGNAGHAVATTLSADERALALETAASLAASGVRFAAVDMAYPWLIEFNLVNPGGLATIEMLTGENLAPNIVNALAKLVPA